MDDREIAQRRMYRQHLWGTRFEKPEAVVRWLGALQAQEYPVAKWSVAQRTGVEADDAVMDEAFARGAILRTHLLRPTWHFVLPADIRWLLALTAPRVHALNAYRYRQLELADDLLSKTDEILGTALEGGRQLTRNELRAILERSGIETEGQRLPYMLMHAELEAVICSGALKGKQHTYALLDDRAPSAESLDRDDALAELTKRFFTGRGPATLKDLLRWSSLTAAEGRSGLDMAKSQLEHESIGARDYWFAPLEELPRRSGKVIDLVQGYDEIVMSYSESKDVLFTEPAARDVVVFTHAVLLNGQLIGHWRRVLARDSVLVEVSLYRPLNRAEHRALTVAVDDFGRFLGRSASLNIV